MQLSTVEARLKAYFSRETADGILHRAVLIASIVAVALLLLLSLYAHSVRQQLMTNLETRFVSQAQLRSDALRVPIDNARRNIRFLAQVPAVQGLVRAAENHGVDAQEQSSYDAWQRRLAALFVGFASANPDVTQVRLIGISNNGMELVRVDRKRDQVTVTADADLQQLKGSNAYFAAASKLKAGEVYISDINLNREHQKLEVPYVPTIRAATPVYDGQGRLFGVLVINFRTAPMLTGLSNNLFKSFRVYLTNSNGDYLASPNFADNFGFDLGVRHVWTDDFKLRNEIGDHMHTYESRVYPLHGKVHVYTLRLALDPHSPRRVLNLSIVASDSIITTEVYSRLAILCGGVLGSILLMASMFYVYWRQRLKTQAAQARFVAIVESSNDAIIGLSMTGVVTNWNKSAEQMFGYTAVLAIGEREESVCASNLPVEEEREYLTRVARGQTVANIQSRCAQKNGQTFAASISLAPIRDENQRVIGISKTVRDITEQKQAELRIQRLNESLEEQVIERTEKIEAFSQLQSAILQNAGLAIIATDPDGNITLFNPAAEHMLGYQAKEVIGRTPEVFHDREEVVAAAAALSVELGEMIEPGFAVFAARPNRGLSEDREWSYIRKDGSRLPVFLTITSWRGKSGDIKGYLGMALDISQQQQDRQQLQLLSDHFKKAAEVADLGIWTWGIQDNTMLWNERMHEIYSVPQEERDQQQYYDFWLKTLHPEDVEDATNKLQIAMSEHSFYDTTFRIVTPEGQIRFIQAAALLELSDEGKPLRMLGINRDITLEREHEASLHDAMDIARAANLAKSAFLANMSHEIRTPMNAILGMQQLLRLTSLDSRQFDYVSKTEAAAQAMLGILNDILDFSKIEAGKLSLDVHDFNFDKMLRDVGTILAGNIGSKEVEVLFDVDTAVPAWIKGDALRLQQVLINLAGNAIKFTAHGEIVVSVKLQHESDTSPRLLIEVRDTGIGIPEEMHQHIFEGFSQAESSTARRYGGSGLGLAISQRLVRLMGGDISFDSTIGVGTTFRFSIPCIIAEGPDLPSPVDIAELRGLRVLVIDDNPYARQILVSMVGQFGWQAHEAVSGAEAITVLDRSLLTGKRFDVVLVDWRMPEMDGWETTRRIQEMYSKTTSPLVVMVTAADRGKTTEQEEMLATHLDGFLIKPITASMLFDAVVDARLGCHRIANSSVPRLVEQRLLGVRILVVEDNQTNQQVARELLRAEGAIVSVAESGRAAINAATQAHHGLDIVLMDIQMPDMDGYAATREIRKATTSAQLPIIALTANALAADREAALAAGMNDHVGKPFDINKLVHVILRHLGRSLGDADASTVVQSEAKPEAVAYATQIDVKTALQRFGGNTTVYGRALRSFAFDARALLERLATLAGSVDRVAQKQNLHALKGLASTIGASNLSNLAAHAEQVTQVEFAPQWPTLQRSAERAIEQAEHLAVFYSEQQIEDNADDMPDAKMSFVDSIDALSGLLRDSNMDALDFFEQVERQHSVSYPLTFLQLSHAMSQLNFQEALGYCDDLLRLAREA